MLKAREAWMIGTTDKKTPELPFKSEGIESAFNVFPCGQLFMEALKPHC